MTVYCNKVKGQVRKIMGYPYSHVVRDTKGSDQPCYCDRLVKPSVGSGQTDD